MTATPITPAQAASPALAELEALYDALLFAVSHDLKSPLLSISLGAELLGAAGSVDDRTRLALDAMRRGAEDLTRLLDAVTLISRARRRALDATPVELEPLLSAPAASTASGEGTRVAVDARVVGEFVAAFRAGSQFEVRADESSVRLIAPWPADAPACEGPPLEALFASLSTHAGTLVGALAAMQVQLERQGGTIVVGGARATALLPRA